MATLTPVDHDPFATSQPKLTPVDTDPFADKPPSNFLIAQDADHPSKVGEWLHTAINTGLLNAPDYIQSKINATGWGDTNKTLEQLRADSAAQREDIGPYGAISADLVGYGVGAGKLGVGAKLAKLAGSRLAARMGGQAVENAATGGASSLMAGDSYTDAAKNAVVGGLIGGATGALPSGGVRPTTPPTSELNAAKQAAFKPLENAWVNSRNVGQNFNQVTSALPTRADLSSSLNSKVDEIAKEIGDSQVLSADTIARYQRALGKSVRGGEDKSAVMGYIDALNTSLGPHAPAVADANALANKFKTSSEIDKWLAAPGEAPKAVASKLNKRPQYYQSEPGLFDALSGVAKRADPPPLWKQLRDYGAKAAIGGGIGAGAGYVMGGNPGQAAVEGALGGVIAPYAMKVMGARPITNELRAAQHLNATGMKVDPNVYNPAWLKIPGMLARTAGGAASVNDPFNF